MDQLVSMPQSILEERPLVSNKCFQIYLPTRAIAFLLLRNEAMAVAVQYSEAQILGYV